MEVSHRAENSVGVIRCVVGIFNPCENRGHHMRDSDVVGGLSLHGDMAAYITGRTARLCSARLVLWSTILVWRLGFLAFWPYKTSTHLASGSRGP